MNTYRPLGLGPIPDSLAGGRVVVRQAGALGVGALVVILLGIAGVGALADPGATFGAGNGFLDRWSFGLLVVPGLYGARRCFLRPQVVVEDAGVRLDNAFSTFTLAWPDVADAKADSVVEVFGTDGDAARTLLFGPAFAGPFTSDARPAELVALIRSEAARRAGREPPSPDYEAVALVADPVAAEAATGTAVQASPSVRRRTTLGIGEAVAIGLAWTLACALAALGG